MWGQPRNPFGGDLIPPADLGVPPLQMPPMAPMAAAVQAKPQSHAFFREGGPGRTIIGILADALAGASGGTPLYGQMMLQKRREQMLEDRDIRQEERKARAPIRDMIGDDYVEIDPTTGTAKVLYHGKPKANDELSRALDLAGIPEADRPAYYRKQIDNLTAPKTDWQAVTDPTTGVKSLVAVPRMPSPLSVTPTTKEQYDALPVGSSYVAPDGTSRVKGGPTPQASGTFR